MTAQVAILNRSAVALASDSAVTVQGARTNVYQTVNKVFTLSKYAPVGVMVYGSATIMGVPWESVVKVFRGSLGKTRFDTLDEYGHRFFEFLGQNDMLFPERAQREFVAGRAKDFASDLVEEIKKTTETRIEQDRPLPETDVPSIVASIIHKYHELWSQRGRLGWFGEGAEAAIATKFDAEISGALAVLQHLPLSETDRTRFRETVAMFFVRDHFLNPHSGVVLAGFGESQIFPAVNEYIVECVVDGRAKHTKKSRQTLQEHDGSMILAFAQQHMAESFVAGVHPEFREFIRSYLGKVFGEHHRAILEGLADIKPAVKAEIEKRVQAVGQALLVDLDKAATEYSRLKHIAPKLETVAVLPKQELAEMAEALVNLASFERRISGEAETVGGPIDVAVISPGDGFVWIKRKHYFKAELNPHFFSNYFRERDEETDAHD